MSKLTHDAVATIGEYADKLGQTKKRFLNVGKVFSQSDGRMSLKLECVPTGKEWSGWISFYPVREQDRDAIGTNAATQPAPARQAQEDIAF